MLTQPQARFEFYTGLTLILMNSISVINQNQPRFLYFHIRIRTATDVSVSQRLKNLFDDAELKGGTEGRGGNRAPDFRYFISNETDNCLFLKAGGIDKELVAKKLNKVRQGKRAISPSQESRYQALSNSATNFNQWLTECWSDGLQLVEKTKLV